MFIPLFRFDARLNSKAVVAEVLADLAGAFDDTELVHWLVAGNAFLRGASPAACLADGAASRVRHAARADRFLFA